MRRLAPLLLIALLPACGMKGDLYLPAPPPLPTAVPAPDPTATEEARRREDEERKTIPPTPDRSRAE